MLAKCFQLLSVLMAAFSLQQAVMATSNCGRWQSNEPPGLDSNQQPSVNSLICEDDQTHCPAVG